MLSTPGPSRGPSSSSRHRDRDRDRARARGGTETGTPRRAGTPPLPTYEPPIAQLNDAGQQALLALLRAHGLRQLKTHLQHVETKLTDSAGEINEKLTDAREKARKRRERERERDAGRSMTEAGDGEAGEGNLEDRGAASEESSRLKGLEESIEALTGRLDASMRRAIDSESRVDGLGEILGALQNEVDANVNTESRRQRPRRRTRRGADEEEEGGNDDEGGLYEATPEPEVDREEISLRQKLEERLDQEQAKWENLTLTERYSENNDYKGFYRIIHDSKHPSDAIPPLPHPSTWFAHLEDTNASARSPTAASSRNTRQQRTRAGSSASADSDDLAIERERISLRCPLTLLPFRDPVTSTKCPHSFEREAITSMISQSAMTAPSQSSSSGRGGRRIRAVKCPVCSEVLTNNDLRDDPALVRRVRRAETALRREREEEEEGELGLSERRKLRQSGITVGSDDDSDDGGDNSNGRGDTMDVDQVRIKQERAMSRGVTETENRGSETQDSAMDEDEDEAEDEDE